MNSPGGIHLILGSIAGTAPLGLSLVEQLDEKRSVIKMVKPTRFFIYGDYNTKKASEVVHPTW